MARIFTLHADSPADKLLFASMDVEERLGALYSHRLVALSRDAKLDLRKLMGKPIAVRMHMPDGYERWFHGIAVAAEQTGFTTVDNLSHAVYGIAIAPKPWLLAQRQSSRIFVDKSVPEIVRAVLSQIGYSDVRLSLSGNYPKREYCVQYREDDLNFISRLMQTEGIYYYFLHDSGKHTMVLADGIGAHSAPRGCESLPYLPPGQLHGRTVAGIGEWMPATAVHTTGYGLTDYDPLNPRASLAVEGASDGGSALHPVDGLESFDFPGGHRLAADGERRARVLAEARNAERARFQGRTGAYGMSGGALFRLSDSPGGAWDAEYLVTACSIRLEESGYASGDGVGAEPYACSFEAIDSKLQFRNRNHARTPLIPGLQTAVVTGADGSGEDEEIAVDEHGRVHVRFHWSSQAKDKDQEHSCPVRVASFWAGKQWGAVHIPRVGQEVVVSFLEGDPDRPLIIGSVYNATHMPPYALPANKTRSGIKSRSADGGADDFNEIRFEDKKGSEELFLHAQKDMREEVENDHFVLIEHDESLEVKNDQAEKIGNDRKHEVGNDDTLDVKANGTTTIGRKFKLDAGTEIELVTGQSSIVMKSSGEIQIKGVNISITGQNSVNIEGQVKVGIKAGATMDVKAGAQMTIKSDAMLQAEGGAMATIKSPMLTLSAQGIAQMSAPLIKIG